MPNLRELLARAAPEPSADWDVTDVARRGRSLRRRRRAAVGLTGGVGVLVALAVAVPALLDGRDTEVHLGPTGGEGVGEGHVEEGHVEEGHVGAIAGPMVAPSHRVVWPFAGPRLIVFADEGLDGDGLAALAEEVADHGAVADVEVLGAAAVADRIGPIQADRVALGGALVVSLDAEPEERQVNEAAHEVVRPLSAEGELDDRVAGLVGPDCGALAKSAALTGAAAAAELLDGVDCDRQVHVVAANPDAGEPWVATMTGTRAAPPPEALDEPAEPPEMILEGGTEPRALDEDDLSDSDFAEGELREPGPPPPDPDPARLQCVEITTVRVQPARGCGGDPEAIDGLTGTRWDRDRAVVAGSAPEGTASVRLDGDEAAVDVDAGELPVFAGDVAVTGSPVTVRARDSGGAVLDEREIAPADLASARGARPGSDGGHLGPELTAGWPFEHVAEAAVMLAPELDREDVAALRRELADVDGVVDVATADDEQVAQAIPPLIEVDEDATTRRALLMTARDRDAALALATLDERHDVGRVHTPTCGGLAGTAAFAGLDHAEALLAEAGCDEPALIGADPEADEPWVAAASFEHGRVCVAHQRVRAGGSTCGSAPPDGHVELSVSGGHVADLVTGRVAGNAEVVELETDEGVHTLEAVAVAEGLSVFATSLPAEAEGEVRARALDGDGEVIAEGGMELPHLRDEPPPKGPPPPPEAGD